MITTFLLVVIMQTTPNVILGVDGEYKTAAECAKEKMKSIRDNPTFSKKLRCMEFILTPEEAKAKAKIEEMRNSGKATM